MSQPLHSSRRKTDRFARATFHHIARVPPVRPTERELRWLHHIARHGPQSSSYLHELTRETHRCRDTSLRALQKLRASGRLRLPRKQRMTERAEFNPYIYDLTHAGEATLVDAGLDVPSIRPTGHWWHGFNVACVTSSIDIAAARHGIRYIPANEILAIKQASLAIPLRRGKLIPDQLFALDYGGRYRVFAVEVDRGTEPKSSPKARKSYRRSLAQYAEVIERDLHRTHYGLKSPLLALWVFNRRSNQKRFLELCQSHDQRIRQSILTSSTLSPYRDVLGLLNLSIWQRAAGDEIGIYT